LGEEGNSKENYTEDAEGQGGSVAEDLSAEMAFGREDANP